MRKKAAITMAVAIIVLTAGVIILRGKMPYKDLKASDIVSATVYFFPPDKTVQITDVEELVSYLGEVTIYNEDVAGFDAYIETYKAGLAIEQAAVANKK